MTQAFDKLPRLSRPASLPRFVERPVVFAEPVEPPEHLAQRFRDLGASYRHRVFVECLAGDQYHLDELLAMARRCDEVAEEALGQGFIRRRERERKAAPP